MRRAAWRAAWAALAMISGPTSAPAQEFLQVPSPILVLDQERLFEGALQAERLSEDFERRSAALAAENRRIEAELVAEELELTELRPTMEPSEFRALADAFDEKVRAIRAEQDDKVRQLQLLREQERQDFLRRVTPVLGEIVRERGAVAVLDRRTLVISAESIDITEEVIARINAEFGETPLEGPAETPGPGPDAGDPDVPAQDP